jgi:hypothetical protein
MLKSLLGEHPETAQGSSDVFSLSEKRNPYLLSTVFIPSIFVSVLTSGNGRNG